MYHRALHLIAILWLVLYPAAASSQEFGAGALKLVHSTVNEAERGQAFTRGRIAIRNDAEVADRLLSVSVEFAEKTTIDGWEPVTFLSKDEVSIDILCERISRKISVDEVYKGVLQFEKAGVVDIDLLVVSKR